MGLLLELTKNRLTFFRLTAALCFTVSCSKVGISATQGSIQQIEAMCGVNDAPTTVGPKITAPPKDAFVHNDIILEGTCDGETPVVIEGGGIAAPVTTDCVNGKFKQALSLVTGEGLKDLRVHQAGIQSENKRCVYVDNTPPRVLITAPANIFVNSQTVSVIGECESGIEVVISQQGATSMGAPCNNGKFSARFLTSNGDGSKLVTATQRDLAGNTGSDDQEYIVDTIAPVVKILTPLANAIVKNNIPVTGTCESGLPVTLSGTAVTTPVTTACANGQFTSTILVSNRDGVFYITAEQTDQAGNRGWDQRNVIRDTTPPAIAIKTPAANTVAATGVPLTGSCTDGLPVVISGTGVSAQQTVQCGSGSFSAVVTFSAGDGVKNVVATQTDSAGNVGSDNRNFIRDNTAPSIKITAPAAGSVTRSTIALSGTCETGLAVSLSGNIAAQTTSCANGTFSATVALNSPDGSKSVTATQTDAVGNIGTDSRAFVLDTTAPTITITGPAANTVSQMGVTLVGVCTTGLPIEVSGGISSPTSATCTNGQFSFAAVFSGADGTKNIMVAQTDAAGNRGSDNRDFVKDTTPPAIAITAPAAGTTAQTGITLVGTCTNGLPVAISGTGVNAPSTTSCTNGAFTSPITFSAGDGTKNVVVSQTDAAGNRGTDNRDFERDATAPVLQITGPAANFETKGPINLTGVCAANLPVAISGAITAAQSVNCVNGNFSASITLTSPDGVKNVVATQTDGAGNVGTDNRNFILDTAGPAIAITAPAAGTVAQIGVTVSGTCTAGLTVNLSGDVNAPSTTTCASGTFSSAITFSSGDGNKNVIASQTDAAGNVGSDNRNFVKDTTAPVITITAPSARTEAQSGLTISGNCTAGLTVNISGAGVNAPSTTTCASGTFSAAITFSSGDGLKNVIASQTDAAGNVGSDNRDFVRNNVGPTIKITGPAVGTETRSQVALVGTCTGTFPVNVSGAIASNMTVACSAGAWSATVTLASPDGSKNVVASQTDSIGNVGSDNRNFVLKTAAPAITINTPAANTYTRGALTIGGACTTGLTVNLSGAISSGTTATCGAGTWTANITLSSPDGVKNVIASQTDNVGNSGSANRDFILDTTAPIVRFTSPAAGTMAQTGLTVTGSCESGLPVQLSGTGLSSLASVSCLNGTFSSNITFSAGDGTKNIVATQTDAAGNSGSDNRDFVRNNVGPAIKITGPAAGTETRSSISLIGTCTGTFPVSISGGITAPATAACSSGAWSANVILSSPDGTKTILASQTDSIGNVGSDSRNFVLKTAAPTITINTPAANTVTKSGLTVGGTCTTGLTVNLSGQISTPTSATCPAGVWTASITLAGADGTKNVVATQTDSVGNTGSANRDFILDATAPLVKITAPAVGTTAQTGLTVSGTCETGLAVQLSGGINPTVSTSCAAGAFSAAIVFSAGDGTKNVVATQTDAAGNVGTDNRDFNKDTTAPIITISSPAALTQTRSTIALAGTCTNGLAITLSGGISPSMAVCTGGAWTAVVTLVTPDGTKNVVASQTDAAGNTGSDNRDFVLKTTAPAIKITGPAINFPTRNGITLTGTCTSGLTVSISGAATGSTPCPAGTFSLALNFSTPDGIKNVTASQTDAAGNTGSDNRDFLLDTSAPVVRFSTPAALTVAQSGLTVTGTCEAGLQVQLSGAGLGTPGPVSCPSGTFSATIVFSAGDGTKNIVATQTDAAGNSGSDNRDFVRDGTAPVVRIATPLANAITNSGFTLTGTCESGLNVNVGGTGLSGTKTATCSNGQFSTLITLASPDGTKNVTVSQTDAAGNTGSDNRNFTLDTTAPNVTITSPANGTNIVGPFTLMGACEAGLALNITGDITSPSTTTCPTSGAYSISLTVTSGNGSKQVTASQTDMAGNTGSARGNFTVTPKPSATETFVADQGEGKVDILFVDDNSASMDPEQAALGKKFPSFVQEVAGLDWQIGVTTTDCSTGKWGICGSLLNMTGTSSNILSPSVAGYDTVFNNTIQRPETLNCAARGECPSGLEEGLKASITAIDKRTTANAGFFRDGAALALVFLTDEDEQSNGPATATKPQAVKDKVTATFGADKKFKSYAITILTGDTACLKTQGDQQGGIAAYGTYPMALASLTGGQSVSICAPDFSATLQQIGQDLRKLTQAVKLSRTPIASSVQVTLTPTQNVTWTVSGDTVLFNKPVSAGTTIDVYYEY